MTDSEVVPFTSLDGIRGVIDTRRNSQLEDQSKVLAELEDGQKVWIPANLLELQEDGSYILPIELSEMRSISNPNNSDFIVLPVIQEQVKVGKRRVRTGGIKVTKRVQEREEVVNEAGFDEQLHVERVQVNKVLREPVSVRQDGDTLIIPVLEEQLVIEKRLVLKEELRITRLRKEIRNAQRVALRSEEVIVDRIEGEKK